MFGEQNWRARLTTTDILAIREDQRISRLIAAGYGVSVAHISNIKSRRTWAHLP